MVLGSFLAILALGQGAVILSGGLDLSVPWTIGFCGILAAGLIQGSNAVTFWAAPLALGVGALIGLVNGIGVSSLGLPPIVMTLATNGVLQGAALLYSNGTPAGFASPSLRWLMTGSIAKITPLVGLMAIFILFGVTLLGRTVFGRWVYAVGNSPRASFLSGVGVKSTTIGVYVLSGFCAALVGVLLTGFSGQASLGMGDDYLLPSIAVVIVGGTLITGGRGSYIGMLGGVLLLTALETLLSGTTLPHAVRDIIYGAVVLVSVLALREISRERRDRNAAAPFGGPTSESLRRPEITKKAGGSLETDSTHRHHRRRKRQVWCARRRDRVEHDHSAHRTVDHRQQAAEP